MNEYPVFEDREEDEDCEVKDITITKLKLLNTDEFSEFQEQEEEDEDCHSKA